jgi:hypothetical protein
MGIGMHIGVGMCMSIGGFSFRGGDMGGGSSSAGLALGCSSTKAGTTADISRSGGAWCAGDGGGGISCTGSGAGAGAGWGGGGSSTAGGGGCGCGFFLFLCLPLFTGGGDSGGGSAIFCGGLPPPPPLSTMWMSLITLPPLHRSLQASLCGSNGPTMVIVLLLSSKEIVRMLQQSG